MKESKIIHLKGMEFYGYHGALEEERVLGQKFVVDADIHLSSSKMLTDDLTQTVDYREIYSIIKQCVEEEQYNLIETLTEEIASKILSRINCIGVKVEVHKPNAPIPGMIRDISIQITREKQT